MILGKNYYGEESINNLRYCHPINACSPSGFFAANFIRDLNYKHLPLYFVYIESCAVAREKGEYLFNESRRKELENKACLSEFMVATMFFGSRSVDWIFGSLEVTTTFLLFRLFP